MQEQIEAEILATIRRAERQRVRPYELLREVSEQLAVSPAVVQSALSTLIEKRELLYSCRGDPFSDLEVVVMA